jgi:hypothetical protein
VEFSEDWSFVWGVWRVTTGAFDGAAYPRSSQRRHKGFEIITSSTSIKSNSNYADGRLGLELDYVPLLL